MHGLGGDGHLHIPVLRHLRQLGRGSLMQLDAHLGGSGGEFGNDRRQLVAGHGVGGGDAQHPAGGQLIPEGKLTNLLHLGHPLASPSSSSSIFICLLRVGWEV